MEDFRAGSDEPQSSLHLAYIWICLQVFVGLELEVLSVDVRMLKRRLNDSYQMHSLVGK